MQINNVTTNPMENQPSKPIENIVCAIDIGTSKIAALVGKRNQYGKVEILGIGNCPSFGVQRGAVINIAKTVSAIQKAVADAERMSGIKFKRVHVGIAGSHIKSLQHRGILTRNNNDTWIDHDDIKKLKDEMYKLALPPGDQILHVLPQEYIVDNEPGIYNEPIGMMGVRLEGNFHIITGAETAIKNIERCITIAGLEIASIELEPLASADAVLSVEELEGGVCLVDIGGGTTDIAIFENFVIRHTAVIPLGGSIITKDLCDFKILKEQAELLKVRYGSAVPMDEYRKQHVSMQGEGSRAIGKKEVNLLAVSKVISARMKEILAHILYQINLSKFDKKLIGGIVLTGGGSQLKHIIQLTEYETGHSARIGLPNEHLATSKLNSIGENPIYATGIGLLIRAFKMLDEEMSSQQENNSKIVVKDIEVKVTNETPETVEKLTQTEVEEIEDEKELESIDETGQQGGTQTNSPSIFSTWKKNFSTWMKQDLDDFEKK